MKAKLVLRTIAPERRLSPAEELAYTVMEGAVREMRAGLGLRITTAHWRAVSASCWLLDEGRQWVETLPPRAADLVICQAQQVVQAAVDAGYERIEPNQKNRLRLR